MFCEESVYMNERILCEESEQEDVYHVFNVTDLEYKDCEEKNNNGSDAVVRDFVQEDLYAAIYDHPGHYF